MVQDSTCISLRSERVLWMKLSALGSPDPRKTSQKIKRPLQRIGCRERRHTAGGEVERERESLCSPFITPPVSCFGGSVCESSAEFECLSPQRESRPTPSCCRRLAKHIAIISSQWQRLGAWVTQEVSGTIVVNGTRHLHEALPNIQHLLPKNACEEG